MIGSNCRLRAGWLLLLIAIFPIAFIWQGLDVTDTGFSLVNMQQFFHAYPGDLTDPVIASCWLSNFLGAVWYEVTGQCGLIGFRVLYLLLIFGVLALVWLPLRNLRADTVLLALFAGTTLLVSQSFYFPSYNEFTVLFFVLAGLALYYGLVRDRPLLIVVAGFVGGISVFARLPNLLIVVIMAAIFFYRGLKGRDWRHLARLAFGKSLTECCFFVVGYVAGIAAMLLLMAFLGHFPTYFQMLHQMSAMAAGSGDIHGSAALLRTLAHDFAYAGALGLLFLVVAGSTGWLLARYSSPVLRFALISLIGLGLAGILLKFDLLGMYLWPGIIYSILVVGALGFLNIGHELRLLCVLSGLILFVTPLGSGNGIYNAIYAMPMAVPVALLSLTGHRRDLRPVSDLASVAAGTVVASAKRTSGVAWKSQRRKRWPFCPIGQFRIDTVSVAQFILLSVIAYSVAYRWHFTYRDSAQRGSMRFSVEHPSLRHVFTTSSRAQSMNELLEHLQPLVRKDDYLFDHMQSPLIYFLTGARPYLYSSWANLYPPAVFRQSLEKALRQRPYLPVFVMTRVDTSHPEWPDQTYPPLSYPRHVENRHAVQSFLQSNHYEKTWQNRAFEIWLPPSYKNQG